MDIEILYEDDDMVVINKPAGLMVHADGKNDGPYLTDWFLARYPDVSEVGETQTLQSGEIIKRPGVVHRLDRETSGVMVMAKTQAAYEHLKAQFQNHSVKKTYHALTWAAPKEDEGVIDRPIGRASTKNGPPRWSAQPGARGTLREAQTHWRVLKRGQVVGKAVALMELTPKTGRTHQLRVHLKALHHPIVCDSLYAPGQGCLPGIERVALHAIHLEFEGSTGGQIRVEAPYPDDFTAALSAIE